MGVPDATCPYQRKRLSVCLPPQMTIGQQKKTRVSIGVIFGFTGDYLLLPHNKYRAGEPVDIWRVVIHLSGIRDPNIPTSPRRPASDPLGAHFRSGLGAAGFQKRRCACCENQEWQRAW
jgi:hypothetical protein